MRFVDYPWMASAAVALALAAFVLVLAGHARRRARLQRFGSPEAIARLAPPAASAAPRARAWRLGVATLSLAIALAGPRWGRSAQTLEVEGVDVAIALDLSLSMLAEDERPNRLERMKQEVRRLRASSPGDRFALIGFAGRSYILSPLTADDGAIDLFLDNLSPSIVGQAGSAIAPPLEQGIDLLLASRGDADRALVVMSDGEAFDDREQAMLQAARAKESGVHLVTVGFGTAAGSTIPVNGPNGRDVKYDELGEMVVTQYDPTLLEALATTAGGEFIPAEATDKGNRIRRALAGLETASREEALRLSRPARYHWFAFVALALLLLDAWFADGGRWPRWLRLRTPGAAILALMIGLGAPQLRAQSSLEDALRAQRDGRTVEAIREYRRLYAEGDKRPVVLYNLGTALLAADSLDGAVEALERALFTSDDELRIRARYNLGLTYLKRGLRLDGDSRSAALQSARRAFRTVLLERPGDPEAQWNYELALRTPLSGGGGASKNSQNPSGSPPPTPSPEGAMSKQQAEALLDAAAREERETQARRQRGNTPMRSAGQKDW